MTNGSQRDMDESPLRSILLIGLVIGSVLLISVAVLTVYVIGRTSASTTSGVGLLMPYDVELRAPPSSTIKDSNTVLPTGVGSFSRKSITGNIGAVTGSVSASYVSGSVNGMSGSAIVAIKVSLDANDDQALADFTRLLTSAPWQRKALQQIRGGGFFQTVDSKSGSVRFVFMQHYWLFDVTANSQLALDAFMTAFPY